MMLSSSTALLNSWFKTYLTMARPRVHPRSMVFQRILRTIYRTAYLVGSQNAPNECKCPNVNVRTETIFLAERDIKREMQIQIEQIISPIAEKSTADDFIRSSDCHYLSHCDCLSISSLISGLSRQGLWPLTSAVHQLSISMLCKKLEACDFGLASRITKQKKCSRCPEDVAAKVAKIREVASTKFEGLCLDCIKNPGSSPEQRLQCRIPHQHFRGLPRQLPVSEK